MLSPLLVLWDDDDGDAKVNDYDNGGDCDTEVDDYDDKVDGQYHPH